MGTSILQRIHRRELRSQLFARKQRNYSQWNLKSCHGIHQKDSPSILLEQDTYFWLRGIYVRFTWNLRILFTSDYQEDDFILSWKRLVLISWRMAQRSSGGPWHCLQKFCLLQLFAFLLEAIILIYWSWPLSTIFFILKDLPFFHSNLWFPSQLCHNDSQVFLNSELEKFIYSQRFKASALPSFRSLSLSHSCHVMSSFFRLFLSLIHSSSSLTKKE
jgi:hypothetical protein